MGEVSSELVAQSYQEQAAALASGGADGLVVETMMDLTEAELAVQAAKSTGLPVVACMTFGRGKNKDRTMMGVSIEEAVKSFTNLGADVLGSNCGQGLGGDLDAGQPRALPSLLCQESCASLARRRGPG